MQPDFQGDYMLFQLDYKKKEMQLTQTSAVIEPYVGIGVYQLSPLVQALTALTQQAEQAPGSCEHYLIDIQLNDKHLYARVHRVEDFSSVVDVPRERLSGLLSRYLTPRETEIAAMLFDGNTIRFAASSLHIAEGTVKRIIYNIYQKLNVRSQVELVREIYARLAQTDSQACPE